MTVVLAVDPGPRWTAMVVRDTYPPANSDDAVVASELLDRDETLPGRRLSLRRWALHCSSTAADLAGLAEIAPDVVAVEAAVAPTAHGGGGKRPRIIDPGPIIETAVIVGAIVAKLEAVIIAPAGFGAPVASRRILEAMYPPSLIGPRETTGSGKSPRQHLRAAFDLAAAAASPIYRRPM